jgi:hypothetical protein
MIKTFMPALTMAMVAPFQLDITGKGFDIKKQLKLSDVGEGPLIILNGDVQISRIKAITW